MNQKADKVFDQQCQYSCRKAHGKTGQHHGQSAGIQLIERRAREYWKLNHGQRDADRRKNGDAGQARGGKDFDFFLRCHGNALLIMRAPP